MGLDGVLFETLRLQLPTLSLPLWCFAAFLFMLVRLPTDNGVKTEIDI